MKSDQDSNDPLSEAILEIAQEGMLNRGGMTPGQIRAALSKRIEGDPSLVSVKNTVHRLWKTGSVTVEPPAPGKRELRVWGGSDRKAAVPKARQNVPPSRPTRERGDAQETNQRVTLCGQLVAEWSSAKELETKEVLRRLLVNFGAEPVGVVGEKVPFQGRRHRSEESVLPGTEVEIEQHGWILRGCPGDYLLGKARVSTR